MHTICISLANNNDISQYEYIKQCFFYIFFEKIIQQITNINLK